MRTLVFVEKLSFWSICRAFSFLLAERAREGRRFDALRFFSASTCGWKAATFLRRLGWLKAEAMDYSYVEVQYPDGSCVGPRVMSSDLTEVCGRVRSELFERMIAAARLESRFNRNRLLVFLEKCLAEELANTLMQINVSSWYAMAAGPAQPGAPVLVIRKTPWHEQIKEYAARKGVTLVGYGWSFTAPKLSLRALGHFGALLGRTLRLKKAAAPDGKSAGRVSERERPPTIAISYQGKGVGLDLSKNTDLFWTPFAPLSREQFLVYFSWSDDPLDDEKLAVLREAGMRGVAINDSGRGSAAAPIWNRRIGAYRLLREFRTLVTSSVSALLRDPGSFGSQLWVATNLASFVAECEKWRCFFSDFGVKIHVDYSDWSRARLPADEAITNLGGISVSYQRADESYSNLLRARAVDVHFAYSPALAGSERASRSDINHFVAAGYTLDYAFQRARPRAEDLRRYLLDRGARFIIAFFDENSVDDKRTCPSHEYRAENYRFLLDRLLSDPELGLILKPKKPSTLRRRLGAVAQMLDEALATGRCFLFEEGVVATPVLPCEASQAADIAIGLLFGTSAALESALAGTPTLLLDREGLLFHPLYKLGEGKVVFRDWDSLWRALCAYRRDPALAPGLGDWSEMLNALDPFRDGRAAERMGQYIGWLAQDLTKGLSREESLEMARRRYVTAWGADKIVSLR